MSTFGKVMLVFIVLAWAGFFVLVATVLKTHDKFRAQYENVRGQLALKAKWAKVLAGDPDAGEAIAYDPNYFSESQQVTVRTASGQNLTMSFAELEQRISQQRQGVLQATRSINKALADRGRWWPNVQPQVNAEGVATLTLPGPPNLTTPNNQNTVFVFEAVQKWDDPIVPGAPTSIDVNGRRTRFVGEFKVSGVNGNTVTLEPAMPLTDAEKALVLQSAQAGVLWNLYETMPTDSYAPLADATEADIAALIDDALETQYLQHGQQANEEIHVPEQIFVLVEFQKDFVDLSQEQKATLESNAWMFKPFAHENIDGAPLMNSQGQPVTVNVAEIVKKGTRARFNLPTANILTGMNVGGSQLATEVPPNPARPSEGKFTREFWRPLNDYPQILRRFYAHRPLILHNIAELVTDNKMMAESIKNLNTHLAARQALTADLTSAKSRLTEEKDLIVAYQEGLQGRADALAAAIADLKQRNQELVQELERLQLERKKQLEEGIASAPGDEPPAEQPAGEAEGDRTAVGRRQ